ncbi:hypothetical protein PRZ48_007681 [Zasmidium cellare]|uniref:Zn(2)-C6 fungal-type domain-containing protein n=1 Tax=Zasmidium cellare TaxID=395010 RepID=A0ABR0EJZ2_ZASCE|nr:hypothetical protein PRZ48_007681 [Zasmidium cellare]
MSSSSYIPLQPTLQQGSQPCSTVFADHYANANAYWQSPNAPGGFSQPYLLDGTIDSNTPLNIDPYYGTIQFSHDKRVASTGGFSKQKTVRATQVRETIRSSNKTLADMFHQACETCRYRKQRCDEGLPCTFCKAYGLECSYRSMTPNKYLTPNANLPSRRVLTGLRLDSVVDSMVKWMSSHANELSALAEKIDKFERLLQKAEQKHSPREAQSPRQRSTLQCETEPPQSRYGSDRRSAWLPVTQWPKISQLFSNTGVVFDTDYISTAEDRSTLRLRPNDPETDCMSGEEIVHTEEEDRGLRYISVLLKSNHAIGANLDTVKIKPIFDSFLDHIDMFHSFLDRNQMQHMFDQFVKRHDNIEPGSCSNRLDEGRPFKRRKTDSPTSRRAGTLLERSPANAMILLALAIGEVTMHREPLSSTSDPLAPFTYSREHESLRLIPGIGYFAAATNIIGDFMDGHELVHAQLFLLAGLYKAQLARTREASSWYSMAGRVLTHLVSRRHLYDAGESMNSTPEPQRKASQPYRNSQDDQILRAAWACLQLEDDLLPELRLPRSGLDRWKDVLLLPAPAASGQQPKNENWPGADKDEQRRSMYTAQLQLWRKFDRAKTLLQLDASHQSHEEISQSFKQHAAALQRWRSQLPPEIQWRDDDQPSSDVLHAGLRRLYWRAKTTILLPFLYHTLHRDLPTSKLEDIEDSSGSRRHDDAQWHIIAAVDTFAHASGEQEIIQLAGLCIEAIKQSLTTYTGVIERLVVPNIQSVAHGCFEDVLLLVTSSENKLLVDLVATEELQQTLSDVVCFLRELSPISPTAAADCSILEGVGQALSLVG